MTDQGSRKGAHCDWAGYAGTRQFFYVIEPYTTFAAGSNQLQNRAAVPRFLETLESDANYENEADPKPVPVWWTIDISAYEMYRAFEGGPIQARPFGSPLGAATNLDAIQRGVSSTHLQARINYLNQSKLAHIIDVDIAAGVRLSVMSSQVNVDLLMPKGTKETVDGVPTPPSFEGLPLESVVVDALIVGSISESNACIGERAARYTQTVFVPAGSTDIRSAIPAAARRVQIYQTPTGNVTPVSFRLYELSGSTVIVPPFALGPNIGQIDFIPGQRRTQLITIPGRATHIAFDNQDPDTNRVYTLVYELELP